MKSIRKKTYRLLPFVLICLMVLSCSDFLDINEDPNNPTEPNYDFLLNSVEVDIAGAMGISVGGLSGITSAYMHQMFSRGTTQGDYGINGQDFEITTPWNVLYIRAGADLEKIINEGVSSELYAHVGIAQILKAYMFSILVDVYGDVPYEEAFQGIDNPNPAYDLGESIYPKLFLLLDSGVANLKKNSSAPVLSASDIFYDANLDNWEKFSNSLKLKMYNQQRLVTDVSTEVNALLDSPDLLFENQEDDFEFQYGTTVTPDSRNPGFAQEYAPGAARYYINPFFYETLFAREGTELNSETYTHSSYGANINLRDPRLDYYFYNQLADGAVDSDAENRCSYCPSNSGSPFLSIFMFSFNIDPNEGFDQSSSQTVAGLYPLGGHFDPTGEGGITSFSLGTPSVPQRLLTHYAQLYTIAELQLLGIANGDARTTFVAALNASFTKVNEIASSASALEIPDMERNRYMDSVLVRYDNATVDEQLEHIITQKWIASYGFAIDAYTDYRRTGYPILPTGTNDGLSVTVQTRNYPFSMPWPTGNLDLNSSSPMQKNIADPSAKVFWDQ